MKHLGHIVWSAWVFSFVLFWAGATTGCQKQYRRGNDGEKKTSQPASKVEPAGDPRFPQHDTSSERHGLWVEEPIATGSLSATALANAVADALPAVRRDCCLDAKADCNHLHGRLLLDLTIDPRGSVAQVTVAETSVHNRAFQNCLREQAGTWQLPTPAGDGAMEVAIPIRIRFPIPGETAPH